MAKKVVAKFSAVIELNKEKGGAWLATVVAQRPDGSDNLNSIEPAIGISEVTAWKNASAAKRWVKTMVQAMTPRKSVKMNASKFDKSTEKPVAFTGSMEFKVPTDYQFGK